MCICFIRCGIKVTLFTIHIQTPKAYFIHAPLWCILGVIH